MRMSYCQSSWAEERFFLDRSARGLAFLAFQPRGCPAWAETSGENNRRGRPGLPGSSPPLRLPPFPAAAARHLHTRARGGGALRRTLPAFAPFRFPLPKLTLSSSIGA